MCGRNPKTYLVDISNERDNEHHTLVDHKALRSQDRCWRSGTFDEINLSAENDGTSLVSTRSASRYLLLPRSSKREGEVDEIPAARRRGDYGEYSHGQGYAVRVRRGGEEGSGERDPTESLGCLSPLPPLLFI